MRMFLLAASALLAVGCGNSGAESSSTEMTATSETSAASWNVDKSQSKLGFSATQNDNRFEGEFTDYTAKIIFDPENLSNASIDVSVSMESAETGSRERDGALPGSDWFKIKEFPTAEFVSTDIKSVGEGSYEATGALTIRDVTKDIVLPFTLDIEEDTALAKGSVTLLRTDFGVGQGEFATGKWVGLEVDVTVDITATR